MLGIYSIWIQVQSIKTIIYTLSLTFVNTRGDKVSISIAGVKPGITQAEASTLMDTHNCKGCLHQQWWSSSF